jgi:flagella basal body P-ring formation protein FlgA
MDERRESKWMQSRVTYLGFFFLIIFSLPLLSKADSLHQSHESIRTAVSDYVQQELGSEAELEMVRLDRRLKLHQCDQPLRIFWPPGSRKSGAISVGVACEDSKPWKIYAQSRVSLMRRIVVLNRPLMRGDQLKTGDVSYERRDISRLNGRYIEDIGHLAGFAATSSINANTVLRASMFRAPKLVKRGQAVIVLAGSPGFEVRVSGKALSDGVAGDRVRVKNTRSKKVVEGRVLENGQIKVD